MSLSSANLIFFNRQKAILIIFLKLFLHYVVLSADRALFFTRSKARGPARPTARPRSDMSGRRALPRHSSGTAAASLSATPFSAEAVPVPCPLLSKAARRRGEADAMAARADRHRGLAKLARREGRCARIVAAAACGWAALPGLGQAGPPLQPPPAAHAPRRRKCNGLAASGVPPPPPATPHVIQFLILRGHAIAGVVP